MLYLASLISFSSSEQNQCIFAMSRGPKSAKNGSYTRSSSTQKKYALLYDLGGVRLDGEKIGDRSASLAPQMTVVLQVGKRKYARVTVQ